MKAQSQIPWFEAINTRARRTQRVFIDEVEDYCVDFSYPNPSLWIVSQSTNIWYRIEGALTFQHVNCAKDYFLLYQSVYEKWLTAAHTIMTISDFPSSTFFNIAQEITVRCPEVTEILVLKYWNFIAEQMLDQPSISIDNIKAEGKLFEQSGGWDGLLQGTVMPESTSLISSKTAKRRTAQMRQYIKRQQSLIAESRNIFDDPKSAAEIGTASSSKSKKLKYPTDDDIYWKATGLVPPVRPTPVRSQQLNLSKNVSDLFIVSYNILSVLRPLFDVPFIGIHNILLMLENKEVCHPILKEIHILLLSNIIFEYINNNPAPLDCQEPVFSAILDVLSFERSKNGGSDQFSDKAVIQNLLRMGDSWLEVARLVLFPNKTSTEYDDPLIDCERIVASLVANPDAVLFCHPVDVPGYSNVVEYPMDLNTVLKRIQSNYYAHKEDSYVERAVHDGKRYLKIGMLVDVWIDVVQGWNEGIILSINDSKVIMVRLLDWGSCCDQNISIDYLLPHRTVSHDKVSKKLIFQYFICT